MGFKVGVALGGGAARGLAHLGVLIALEESGIPIDIVTGASFGAIIGATYVSQPNITECVTIIDQFLHSKTFEQARLEFIRHGDEEKKGVFFGLNNYLARGVFFAISISSSAFISSEMIKKNLASIIPSIPMSNCRKKLGIVAMDLHTGDEKQFLEGDLLENTLASCAIPGIFPPVEIDSQLLVDGSWIDPIPVDLAAKMGADFIIAVDITPKMSKDSFKTGLQISHRASEASRQALKNKAIENADITISIDLMDMHWADFSQLYRSIAIGKQETLNVCDTIKKKLFRKKMLKHVKDFFL